MSHYSSWSNLHQDLTGANQAMGIRVQHLIFGPHSRTSYLDAEFREHRYESDSDIQCFDRGSLRGST